MGQNKMIKLLDILKEEILTKHYKERKLERGKIIDIVIPPDAYEGYDLIDVKEKLIPILTKELNSKLDTLERTDIGASDRNIVIIFYYALTPCTHLQLLF